ncbi:MAG: glutathione peroxidase [Pseudomonadota bacterium]
MNKIIATLLAFCAAGAASADISAHRFANIDGGTLDTADWAGQPVLVVNTASQCGFTGQYAGLQALFDSYRDAGLVVLAVPSDDFRQELDSAEEIKEFCEMNYGLDLPMTDITTVLGDAAHPFYRELADEAGFVPRWNFNKVLIGPDGAVVGTWGSNVRPQSRQIVGPIEELLGQGGQG